MTKHILAIAALALPLTFSLTACEREPSRVETTTLEEPSAETAECMAKFADRGTWGDDDVDASFVYDIGALDGDQVVAFWGGDPSEVGQHSAKIVESESEADGEEVQKEFLDSEPAGDTEVFRNGETVLMRVNDPSAGFEEALKRGCERLRDGVTIKQVTFARS